MQTSAVANKQLLSKKMAEYSQTPFKKLFYPNEEKQFQIE